MTSFNIHSIQDKNKLDFLIVNWIDNDADTPQKMF